jgi:pimeloyl-ACP methyl ester carboxylesterase
MINGQPVGMPMTWKLMSDDVGKLLEEIKRPVTIIGHSLGGQVGMQALSTGIKRIEKFIAVDIAPVGYDFSNSTQMQYINAMQKIDDLHLPRKEAIKTFKELLPDTDELVVQFLFTNYGLQNDQHGFLIPLESLKKGMIQLGQTFRESFTGDISTPVLFIRGGRSDYINDENISSIESNFRNYSIETMPASGHWPHYEHPEEFIQIIGNNV